jgi:hypothetical protein
VLNRDATVKCLSIWISLGAAVAALGDCLRMTVREAGSSMLLKRREEQRSVRDCIEELFERKRIYAEIIRIFRLTRPYLIPFDIYSHDVRSSMPSLRGFDFRNMCDPA